MFPISSESDAFNLASTKYTEETPTLS